MCCNSRPPQQLARERLAARACTTRSLSLPDCLVQRFFAASISSKPADSDTPSSLYASCRDIDAGKEASGSDDDLAIVQHRRGSRASQLAPSGPHSQDARSACEAGWDLQAACDSQRPSAAQLALPAKEPTDMAGQKDMCFRLKLQCIIADRKPAVPAETLSLQRAKQRIVL